MTPIAVWPQIAGRYMNRTFRRLLALSVMFMTAGTPVRQSNLGPTLSTRTMGVTTGLADALPPMRSFAGNRVTTPTRSNREIGKDFMDLAFRMESGRAVARLTRFEAPISVRITGDVPPSLTPDLRALLGRLRNEAGIDIFMTGSESASITVEAIPRSVLNAAVLHVSSCPVCHRGMNSKPPVAARLLTGRHCNAATVRPYLCPPTWHHKKFAIVFTRNWPKRSDP